MHFPIVAALSERCDTGLEIGGAAGMPLGAELAITRRVTGRDERVMETGGRVAREDEHRVALVGHKRVAGGRGEIS